MAVIRWQKSTNIFSIHYFHASLYEILQQTYAVSRRKSYKNRRQIIEESDLRILHTLFYDFVWFYRQNYILPKLLWISDTNEPQIIFATEYIFKSITTYIFLEFFFKSPSFVWQPLMAPKCKIEVNQSFWKSQGSGFV